MSFFKMCLQPRLLSLILIGLIVVGFIDFVDITRVFGQTSITLKWRKSAGIGSTWMGPLAADLNKDGLMEIVITGSLGVAALDPISGNVIWSRPYGGDHVPFEIIDLDKDGIPEILLGPQYINGSSGGVLALRGNNGSVYWYSRQAACKGTYIAVADINADGYPEIYSALPGKVTALTYDGRIFASTYTYYCCWGGLTVGDTDFDGVFEVYLGERSNTYPSYPSGGRGLRAFWADNLTERWCHPELLCSSQAPVLADVDKDGDLEIIVLDQYYSSGVAVFNTDGSVNTYKGIYRWGGISGLQTHSNPPVADLDGDGNLELITCSDDKKTYTPPKIVDLVDWKLDATLPFACNQPPGVADIDGDEKLEIIAPNQKNVTIFKYYPATENYEIMYTIPRGGANPFSIVQDIDADGKLELVFDENNQWVSVYDVETPAPTLKPRSGLYFYSQYRTRVPVYVPSPEYPPKIAKISPRDGATNVLVSLSELSFKLTDYQNKSMSYTVTTNPNIGGPYSGINVPNGTFITIPVSGLAKSTTYTWTVTATDGTYSTTRTFTFYTEGSVVLTISTVGDGSVTRNPDNVDNVYAYGTLVRLTAVADNVVYRFSNWGGDLAWMGSNNPATILMNEDKSVIANFTKVVYRLRTYVSPTGCGSVNVNKTAPYYYGDIVELTAVPNAGWSFSHWMNDTTGSQNPTTIIMNSAKRVTAVFTQDQYSLTIVKIGNGNVAIEPGKTTYTYGENVILTATADPDWTFAGWTGDASGTANPITVIMTGSKTVTATFEPAQNEYTITASAGSDGVIDPSGSVLVLYGEDKTFTITPDEGYHVVDVVVDSISQGPLLSYTFPFVTANHAIAASFAINQFTISASAGTGGSINPSGSVSASYNEDVAFTITPDTGYYVSDVVVDSVSVGAVPSYTFLAVSADHTISASFMQIEFILSVIVSPDGSGSVSKNPDYAHYHYNDIVQLTAEPNAGYSFSTWSDDLSGSANPASLTITGDMAVTATFIQNAYTLTISTVGSGSVVKVPDQATYTHGTSVQLTATAEAGWTFAGWSGDLSGTQSPVDLVMDSSKTITATFIQNEYTLDISIVGFGSVAKAPDQSTYHYNDVIELTALPDAGWSFSGWSGDLSGSANPASITIDGNKAVTATFTQDQYTLTLSMEGSGSVSKAPNQATYTYGSSVELTASPEAGWYFSYWSGDLAGSSNPYMVIVTHSMAITAHFSQSQYTLIVNIEGSGSVDKVPDQATYGYGITVQLTATPALGWSFAAWGGDLSGSTNPATIVMDGNKIVTATFTQNQYTLTINSVGSGSVSKIPDQATYVYGTSVGLTAAANLGWSFSQWTGDATGSVNPATITITGNMVITATFTEDQYTLTINTFGSGSVIKSPDQGTYTYGTSVELTAVPALGWSFAGWTGDLSGAANPDTITMDSSKTVTATFTQNQYTLTINIVGQGSVSKEPDQATYTYGATVQLTATPTLGWSFNGWSGDFGGNHSPVEVVMDGNKIVTATFSQGQYTLDITVVGSGTVTKVPDQATYNYGDVVQLTATPNAGWSFSAWSGDLTGSTNPASLTLTGDMSITATFTQNQITWTITASAGTGGSIDPTGAVTVADGTNQLFTITPDSGYAIADVVVDGVSQGAVSEYTFIAVAMDHTIVASFIQGTYTITASVDGIGGTIDPSGAVTVNGGEDKTFTITPDTGYHVLNVMVDGTYMGPQNSFTFYEVDCDHTIISIFAKNEYTLTIIIVGAGSVSTNPNKISYSYGDIVELTAIPNNKNIQFVSWSGDLTGNTNPTTIIMDGNKTVTATFTRKPKQ